MSIYQNICTHELDFELCNALFKKYMYFIQYIHVNTLNWIERQATCRCFHSYIQGTILLIYNFAQDTSLNFCRLLNIYIITCTYVLQILGNEMLSSTVDFICIKLQ